MNQVVFLVIALGIFLWWFFKKEEKIPIGKIVEGADTSSLFDDVLNFGPDLFVEYYQMGQGETTFLHPETMEVVDNGCDVNILEGGITRCACTAHAFCMYLCGSRCSGNGIDEMVLSAWETVFGDDIDKWKFFRGFVESNFQTESLWEINVHRKSAPQLGHVFVVHHYREYWDVYMSFISEYSLSKYMKWTENNHPMKKEDVHEFINKLEKFEGVDEWTNELNDLYNELFHVNLHKSGNLMDLILGKDEIEVSISLSCMGELNI